MSMLRSAEGNGRQAREPNMASKFACLASSARPQHSQRHRMRVQLTQQQQQQQQQPPGQPGSCPSYAKFSSAPCKKVRGQCNNVPLLCPECIDGRKQVVWKYGLAAHYAAKHPHQSVEDGQPIEMVPKEVKRMQKVAMSVHAP